jgi:hypothetical protein
MNQIANAETAPATYRDLYKLGGVTAWIAAVLILCEVIILAFFPPPSTVSGWFLLFQSHRLIALLDFWGLELPLYLLFTISFLALFVALRSANQGRMAIALTVALLGIAIFLATNNPFAMLSLSNQYAAATTDTQRAALLAAGQTLLANTNQRAVGGFNMGLLLVSLAGLIVSSVMRQSHSFSKATAYIGLLAHTLSLADYLRQALTSSALVALLVILPNALCLVIWYILVGRRLYQLGRLQPEMLPKQPQSDLFT